MTGIAGRTLLMRIAGANIGVFAIHGRLFRPPLDRRLFPMKSFATLFCAAMSGFLFIASPGSAPAEEAETSLFDGASLAGWKAAEDPASFRVEDGAIVCNGPRAHLFYVGADGKADFENFELTAEVKTKPGTNSGIYFHTAWQETNWPSQGFEVQVDNSQKQHGDYLEYKMTGSLYGIRNVYKALVPDDEWFTMTITVQRPRVQVRLNGTLVVDYVEPAEPLPEGAPKLNHLGRGTFALQAHDPESTALYRNLRVKPMPAGSTDSIRRPILDAAAAQRLALGKENFALVDLHTHLKGGLTLDHALAISRETGMGLGIAANCGEGFPIQDDSAALAFLADMKDQPVFLALQAEGREWVGRFSKETRAQFDYVFTDAMTFTNAAGRRLRLWIPEETEIGPDVQVFMDYLVTQAVKIISTEPIDIYVNPTYLPDMIARRYDELWTDERMQKVIDAAVKHGVAIELNARYKLPSERFIRLAKAAGAKFTIGTNNTTAKDFGDWSYPMEMQKKVGLTWKDMWVPGHQPSRAQRELNSTGTQ
jgi:hypothetical protein